jgi:hypothetical protein
MRTFLMFAVAAFMAGPALAQTQPTSTSAYPTSPTIRSADSTSALSPCYSGTNLTSPCYSAGGYLSYSALTAIAPPPASSNPDADVHSFTLDQAKSRIEAKGYSNVSDLQKDSRGVWRGKAMKDGKSVNVILDFPGNLVDKESDLSKLPSGAPPRR